MITYILDYFMKFIIENVLNQPHVIIFLLGYVSGILTICLYLWFFKKPEYSKQLNTIQQFFKISVFGITDGSNIKQEVVTTRARTRSDAEKEVTRLKRSNTINIHKANQEITNYFMIFLTILRKIKNIKELKSDIQVAEDKIKNIQDKYYL
jgi:hypothetical protein